MSNSGILALNKRSWFDLSDSELAVQLLDPFFHSTDADASGRGGSTDALPEISNADCDPVGLLAISIRAFHSQSDDIHSSTLPE